MKKYMWINIISLLLLQSCIPQLIIANYQKKEGEKIIKIAKKYHFKGWNDISVDKIFKKVSKNKYNWGYLGNNRCNCLINLTYVEPPTYYTKNIPMIFYFKYDPEIKDIKFEKVLEVYTNRWYEESIALDKIIQTLMYVYYQQ